MLLSSSHKGATPHTALPTRPHGTGAVLYAYSPWCKNWCYPRLQLRKWGFREVKGTQGLESSSFHRVILPPGLVKGTDMYRSAPIPSRQAAPQPCPPGSCGRPQHLSGPGPLPVPLSLSHPSPCSPAPPQSSSPPLSSSSPKGGTVPPASASPAEPWGAGTGICP